MKNLFLASFIFIGITSFSFGQNKVTSPKTQFIVKDKDDNKPIQDVEAVLRKKVVGVSDAQGIISLNEIEAGDSVLFRMPHPFETEGKVYEPIRFIVPVNSHLNQQQIFMKGYIFEGMNDVAVPEPPAPPIQKEDEIYTVAEVPAEFPGGKEAMFKYLKNSMTYPEDAIKAKLEGKCYLKFVVHKDGSISDVQVMRGVPNCPQCDREAIRVVKSMPKWIPAKDNGKTVDSYFTLPFTFYLGR